ncbi:MAG: restriction endonuclease subunit R, partial [Actinobacteria bacterium]
IEQEIKFPRLLGYRYEVKERKLTAEFSEDSRMALSSEDIPFKTENAPIVGKSSTHTLDDLKRHREQEVAFLLSKLVLEKYFRSDGSERTERTADYGSDSEVQMWLFPQILRIARSWMNECVTYKDGAFPQLMMLVEPAHEAADKIYRAIVASSAGERHLKPILRPYDTVGTTRYVDFDTTRPVYVTDPKKCHISHVVADTQSWEQKMAQVLEDMDEVARYVKNHNLGFTIPYTIDGEERNYIPDFIAHVDDGHGPDDLLNLIVEVSGEKRKDKDTKVSTARTLWVPAVNNHGEFGRWAFVEISDPWDAQNTIRGMLKSEQPAYVS